MAVLPHVFNIRMLTMLMMMRMMMMMMRLMRMMIMMLLLHLLTMMMMMMLLLMTMIMMMLMTTSRWYAKKVDYTTPLFNDTVQYRAEHAYFSNISNPFRTNLYDTKV